jgi:hypothetical protein
LNLLLFNLNPLLFQKFSLSFAFKNTSSELTLPLAAIGVDIVASPVKQVVQPLSLVDSAVDELVNSLSVVPAVPPRAPVDRPVGIVVGARALHLVLFPLALVELLPHSARSNVLDGESALAVF